MASTLKTVLRRQGLAFAALHYTWFGHQIIFNEQTLDGTYRIHNLRRHGDYGRKYEVGYVSFGMKGSWAVANADATSVDFERMSNGQYLMTVTISLLSTPTSEFVIPVGDRGYDLVGAPKTITSRLLLNASKTQILAQAVLVPGA